jgi:hypothetical protein
MRRTWKRLLKNWSRKKTGNETIDEIGVIGGQAS